MNPVSLENVMRSVNNRFEVSRIKASSCEISGGSLPCDMQSGQWYWIEGSVFNDGLHQHPAEDLTDETFEGVIVLLAPPKAFLALADKIEAWETANDDAMRKAMSTPYSSESFGGYEYTIRDGITGGNGGGLSGWQAAFASDLNRWRKL